MKPHKKSTTRHIRPPSIKPGAVHKLSVQTPLSSSCKVIIMGYGPAGFEETEITNNITALSAFAEKFPVVWVDVDGLGNAELIISLGKILGIDRLVLEDVFDVNHQPKIEMYEKYIFMLLKKAIPSDVFDTEQVSIVLMEKFVVTFQERPGDSFAEIHEQIRLGTSKIRQFGSDYLAYALVDAVVEGYYPILTFMRQKLDAIEDTFITESGMNVIQHIHDLKNDLLLLHSTAWPIRDITLALSHDDTPVVTKATAHYLRDCQDQANRVTQMTEFYRLIASDLMNTYLAFNDYKANQVMKVLTMVATVFIPLSFISSLYGMNFDYSVSPYNMPELHMRYGYPTVLTFMLCIVTGILLSFKRLGWFGRTKFSPDVK